MSLQVWLPLNGDLHNQGLANIEIVNNGATVDDNGKIGKCYSFDGSSQHLKITNINIISTNVWSLAAWVYPVADTTSGHQYIVGMNTSTSTDFLGVLCYYKNKFGVRIKGTTYSAPATSAHNVWYHVVAVYNNAILKLYINGILIQTWNSVATPVSASTIYIGVRGGGLGHFNGLINDVRVYDHALSNKEIEEISKGLILHYKLDGLLNGINENYLANSSLSKKVNNIPSVSSSYTQTFEIIDGYPCFHIHSDKLKVTTYLGWDISSIINSYPIGTKFTLSGWIKTENIVKGTTNYFATLYYGGDYNNNGTSTWIGEGKRIETNTSSSAIDLSGKGWTYCYIVSTFKRNDYLNMHADYYLRDFTGDIYLRNFKFEVSDHPTAWVPTLSEMGINNNIIYDSSGYNNDGTVTGSLGTVTPSPRYSCATSFDGSSIIAIGTQLYNMKDEMTVSLWIDKDWSINTGTPFSSVQSGGFGWQVNSTNYTFYCGTGTTSNTYVSKAITTNNLSSGWHMLSATYDGLALKLYIDGALKSTTTKYSTKTPLFYNSKSGMFVGGESAGAINTTSTDRFIGSLSDLRIYATALSDDQIKELYNTAATIDNLGNTYARELVE